LVGQGVARGKLPKQNNCLNWESKMIRYEVIIYWSEEDQAFIAEVPELSGCMADGQNYQEALANVEVIIQEWIETAKELGRPIPEPKGRLIYA
jgi:predicted RNase H-like HicB family nuclease